MAELTDREKKIIHMVNTMNNPTYKDAPFQLKTTVLQSVLLSAGYEWNESEMTDLMQAIGEEVKSAYQHGLKLLDKYKDNFKGLNKI